MLNSKLSETNSGGLLLYRVKVYQCDTFWGFSESSLHKVIHIAYSFVDKVWTFPLGSLLLAHSNFSCVVIQPNRFTSV